MPGVFVNYRNGDGTGYAMHLDHRLSAEFGRDAVFRASRSILPADDYIEGLLHAVRNCSVLVAVIGPHWETMPARNGRRRLDNEDDWVRRELVEAFRNQVPVLPILVDNVLMPNPEALPDEIAWLAKIQYIRLGTRNEDADIATIVQHLRRLAPDLGRAEPVNQPYQLPSRSRVGPRGLLSEAEWNELLAAFHAIDRLWDPRLRQEYIERAEGRLGRRVPFPARSNDREDIYELVAAWLEQPGALHVLAAVLTADLPGSPDAVALARAISIAVPAPALTSDERRRLSRMTGTVDQHTAVRAYHRAFGDAPPPMRHDPIDLPTILADLEEVVSTPGEVPLLLRYLEHLADAGEAYLDAAELRQLSAEIAARMRVPSNNIDELRRQIRGEGDAVTTFLVIRLQPDGASDDRYLVKASIRRGSGRGQSLGQPDVPLTVAQVKDYVDQLLIDEPNVAHLAHTDDNLWLEFVLPRSLLDADVDQWEFGHRIGFPRHLGRKFRVTIRSLEREQRHDLHAAWRKRRRQQPSWAGARSDAVHWIPVAGRDGERLLLDLEARPDTVCLAFGFTPLAAPELGKDEYAVGLYAGIPVMLWSRDRGDPSRLWANTRAIVDAGGIAAVADEVRQRRQAAALAGADTHLTLLYEPIDPAPRLPDRFRSPA